MANFVVAQRTAWALWPRNVTNELLDVVGLFAIHEEAPWLDKDSFGKE